MRRIKRVEHTVSRVPRVHRVRLPVAAGDVLSIVGLTLASPRLPPPPLLPWPALPTRPYHASPARCGTDKLHTKCFAQGFKYAAFLSRVLNLGSVPLYLALRRCATDLDCSQSDDASEPWCSRLPCHFLELPWSRPTRQFRCATAHRIASRDLTAGMKYQASGVTARIRKLQALTRILTAIQLHLMWIPMMWHIVL